MVPTAYSLRDRAINVLGRLPRLSAGSGRLLSALAKRDSDPVELASIIQRDPILAPNILELANSAIFGRLRRIESIQHAVLLIGKNTLRRHAIRWTIGSFFRSLPELPGWSTSKFTSHSEAVALLSDTLCDHIPIPGADGAYIAGLVHDVGKFVFCAEAFGSLDVVRVYRDMTGVSQTEAEREVMGIDHAELSSMAAHNWQLPEEVCQAIQSHHEPHRDTSTAGIPLSFVLSKADAFVNGLGITFLSEPADASQELDWPGYETPVMRALMAFEKDLKAIGVSV